MSGRLLKINPRYVRYSEALREVRAQALIYIMRRALMQQSFVCIWEVGIQLSMTVSGTVTVKVDKCSIYELPS